MTGLASWNVSSLRVRLPPLTSWLDGRRLGVIGLQETQLTDAAFPKGEIEAPGYHLATRSGEADIDTEPRRAERPSDHGPALARFETA